MPRFEPGKNWCMDPEFYISIVIFSVDTVLNILLILKLYLIPFNKAVGSKWILGGGGELEAY